MRTNKHGVARFEAATLSRSAVPLTLTRPIQHTAGRVAVALVMVLTTLLVLLGYRLFAKPLGS